MFVYASYLKMVQPISFFFQQTMRIWYLDFYKKKKKGLIF